MNESRVKPGMAEALISPSAVPVLHIQRARARILLLKNPARMFLFERVCRAVRDRLTHAVRFGTDETLGRSDFQIGNADRLSVIASLRHSLEARCCASQQGEHAVMLP